MSQNESKQEDRGLVSRWGSVEIEWPKLIGYYGGIGLAVAAEVIEPPLALFIAAVPLFKMLKRPKSSLPVRAFAGLLEGAAVPVGGEAEAAVRIVDAQEQAQQSGGDKRAQPQAVQPAPAPA